MFGDFAPADSWVTPDREQFWFRFENGYGASIFRRLVQTGHCGPDVRQEWDFWEMAVQRKGRGGWQITGDTSISADWCDSVCRMDTEEVVKTLARIAQL